MFKRFSTLWLCCLLAVLITGFDAQAQSVNVEVVGEREVITLQVPAQASKVFTLSNPERLVVDVPATAQLQYSLPPGYQGSLIRNIRTGQFSPQITRIVFDLHAKPASMRTETRSAGGRIDIRIELVAGAAQSPKPPEDTRPMVIIDAGHGGRDPGAIGKHGMREKKLVLKYAEALRDTLLKTGRYKVMLTRDDDTFILLRDRVKIAREAKGDLFISLHADSAPGANVRGLSVYTLSEKASDKETEALAAQENKVDVVYGLDLSDQSEDVKDILISLAQRDTNNRSATLADTVVDTMQSDRVRLLRNSHRFAGFAVLKAPDIPSVLVEIGFLSNREEEKQLQNSRYRAKVVGALVKGIDAFFRAKQKSI